MLCRKRERKRAPKRAMKSCEWKNSPPSKRRQSDRTNVSGCKSRPRKMAPPLIRIQGARSPPSSPAEAAVSRLPCSSASFLRFHPLPSVPGLSSAAFVVMAVLYFIFIFFVGGGGFIDSCIVHLPQHRRLLHKKQTKGEARGASGSALDSSFSLRYPSLCPPVGPSLGRSFADTHYSPLHNNNTIALLAFAHIQHTRILRLLTRTTYTHSLTHPSIHPPILFPHSTASALTSTGRTSAQTKFSRLDGTLLGEKPDWTQKKKKKSEKNRTCSTEE